MKGAPNPAAASFRVFVEEGEIPVTVAIWTPVTNVLALACTITQDATQGFVRMVGDDPGLENDLNMRAVPVLVRKFHNPTTEPHGPLRGILGRMMAWLKSQGLIPPNTKPPWAHP